MTTPTPKYYKAFRRDGRTLQGRDPWPLPADDGTPGAWLPELPGDPVPGRYGYHIMRESDLSYWPGWSLYAVEIGDGPIEETDDLVVTTAPVRLLRRCERWTEETLHAWLRECVERAHGWARAAIAADVAYAEDAIYAANAARAHVANATDSAHAADSAAHAAAHAAGVSTTYLAERAWQSERMRAYVRGITPKETRP